MKNESFENKVTDLKKRENTRRTELGMLGELIERYPREAMEKLKKQMNLNPSAFPRNPLVLRE